ncbi:hypothetical protein M404DRAFT_36866 [Pisolithus tinctorius Marx 270]|uniref:Uncharacterized protein n=1 Tax=Pisolithus tinctorius Marx 270 TaxID=870435 RepID=A0A0C3NAQ7_PISTI|nr:hypothetical protein M404DRAFT_36866 [Pisolithus tinctorius Marx 270]
MVRSGHRPADCCTEIHNPPTENFKTYVPYTKAFLANSLLRIITVVQHLLFCTLLNVEPASMTLYKQDQPSTEHQAYLDCSGVVPPASRSVPHELEVLHALGLHIAQFDDSWLLASTPIQCLRTRRKLAKPYEQGHPE